MRVGRGYEGPVGAKDDLLLFRVGIIIIESFPPFWGRKNDIQYNWICVLGAGKLVNKKIYIYIICFSGRYF